jgi:hypothetical protein
MQKAALIMILMLLCGPGRAGTPGADRCLDAAAAWHHVHPHILRAVLMTESAMNPQAVHRNANGSLDVGLGQINSVHFPELARHGVSPMALTDACVGSYVAAWHLARQQAVWGNTWYAIGAYHSTTPALNQRYQQQVFRQWQRLAALRQPS